MDEKDIVNLLIRALKFYSSPETYKPIDGNVNESLAFNDRGFFARKILIDIGVYEEKKDQKKGS